jgi:diguanylate cyclase (GGDEF)-like protein/PAS domain S-box-containing protein
MKELEKLNREQIESVFAVAHVAIWDWMVQTGELFCNAYWANIVGYSLQELQPLSVKTWATLVHPDDLEKARQRLDKYLNGEIERYEIEFRMQHKQGHYVWILATGKTIEYFENNLPKRMVGSHLDITQRKHDEKKLETTTSLLDAAQKIAKVGGWELDIKSGSLFWTKEIYRIYETSPEAFNPTVESGLDSFTPDSKRKLEEAINDAINRGENYQLELKKYTKKGGLIDVRTTCVVSMKDNKPVKLTGSFQDISEQKAIQRQLEHSYDNLARLNEKLKHSANYDALTGLPNRIFLADRMQQSLAKSERSKCHIAIAFIDLDGFKEINDAYGHSNGDDLLCKISKKIQDSMRACDTLSRFGGDEFVMILDELKQADDCIPLLKRTLESIASTTSVNHKAIKMSASIGVTIFPQDNSNSDQLIRHADQAMYIAKNSGKNCFHIFDVAKGMAATHQYEEIENIRAALKNNEFVLYYQPKINMKTNEVVGLEALIRWQHPLLGLLLPSVFLPIIEQNALSIDIGEWVINTALTQLCFWSESGLEIPVSVNISALQLKHPDFVNRLQLILKDYPHYKPGHIEFEILETSALGELERIVELIERCHELGILFSIDDFGTGYSSLTYLKRLPADHLKIDESFVRDMLHNADDRAIVQGVIQLAQTFDKAVIAEGVESIAHGEQLISLGCHLAQGFGISKPIPAEKLSDWLTSWAQKNEWQFLSSVK